MVEDHEMVTAGDGFRFRLYRFAPKSAPRGAVIILQEIFGVTGHIKDIARRFSREGYVAFVPALFDRIQRDCVIPYDQTEKGRATMMACRSEDLMLDIGATLGPAQKYGDVALVGYCWGGTLAYLAARRFDPACMVSLYGSRIAANLLPAPECPCQFHFGQHDPIVSQEDVAKIKEANPGQAFFTYDAGHAFCCAERPTYNQRADLLAHERIIAFLKGHGRKKIT